jgi:uncharacterized membrane protein
MAPLIILLISFILFFLTNKFFLNEKYTLSLIGRVALAIMLVITGVAHFINTDLMNAMLPEVIPLKKEIVLFTGALEIAASVGLIMNKTSKLTSILLILFFIVIIPANIKGNIDQVPLGGMEKGIEYLYFRIPLQLLFIAWAYYFGIRKNIDT